MSLSASEIEAPERQTVDSDNQVILLTDFRQDSKRNPTSQTVTLTRMKTWKYLILSKDNQAHDPHIYQTTNAQILMSFAFKFPLRLNL